MQLYLSVFSSYQFVEILLGRVNLSIGRDSPSKLGLHGPVLAFVQLKIEHCIVFFNNLLD